MTRRKVSIDDRTTPCQCCEYPISQRHHLLEFAEWGENEMTIQLCPNCHELFHILSKVELTPINKNNTLPVIYNQILQYLPRKSAKYTRITKLVGFTHRLQAQARDLYYSFLSLDKKNYQTLRLLLLALRRHFIHTSLSVEDLIESSDAKTIAHFLVVQILQIAWKKNPRYLIRIIEGNDDLTEEQHELLAKSLVSGLTKSAIAEDTYLTSKILEIS